ASGLQSVGVKFLDRGVVGRAERDVRAGGGWPLVRIEPERRLALGAKSCAGSVARTQDESERRQCRRVEAHAGVQIADFQSDMVVHDDLRSLRAFENARTGDQPSQCRARRSWKILRMPREPSRNLRGETPAARWNVRTKLERSPKPTSLRPSAAACASSPSTINSGSGGALPIRQASARSPIACTSSGPKKNDRHSSPQTWSWVQTYSSPGWPTRIDPATSSKKRPWLRQPKLPLRT